MPLLNDKSVISAPQKPYTKMDVNIHKILCIISQIILINGFNAESKLGNHCILTKTGQPGVCDYQQNCQEVVDDLKKGRFPTICGFANRQRIVCCPNRQVNSDIRISTKSKNEHFYPINKTDYERNSISYRMH